MNEFLKNKGNNSNIQFFFLIYVNLEVWITTVHGE